MTISPRWLVIVAGLLLQAVTWGAGLTGFTLWGAPWIRSFGASHGEIMAAALGLQLGLAAYSPIAGHLVEKIGLRRLMIAGLAVTALSYGLISQAQAMWQVTLLHVFVLSAGLVCAGPLVGHLMAVRLFQPQPGAAIGIVNLGMSAGGFVMPLIMAWSLSHYGWRVAAIVVAGVVTVFIPVILLIAGRHLPSAAHEGAGAAPTGGPAASAPLTRGQILGDRVFIGIMLCLVPLNLLFNAVFFNLGPLLADRGIGEEGTAAILAASAVIGALGTAGFGAMVDRIDFRILIFVALMILGGGTAAAALGGGYLALLVVIPLMGGAAGGMFSLVPGVLARHFGPGNFARANSMALGFSYLGALGSLLAGVGRDVFGNYEEAFAAVCSVLVLAGAGLVLLIGRRSAPVLAKS